MRLVYLGTAVGRDGKQCCGQILPPMPLLPKTPMKMIMLMPSNAPCADPFNIISSTKDHTAAARVQLNGQNNNSLWIWRLCDAAHRHITHARGTAANALARSARQQAAPKATHEREVHELFGFSRGCVSRGSGSGSGSHKCLKQRAYDKNHTRQMNMRQIHSRLETSKLHSRSQQSPCFVYLGLRWQCNRNSSACAGTW